MMDIDWDKAMPNHTHYCRSVKVFIDASKVEPCNLCIPRPTKPAAAEWDGEDKPDAYMCPAGCGCLWRDNGDETMSLYGPRSQSCDVCEPLPLARLIPVMKLRTKEQRERQELINLAFGAVTGTTEKPAIHEIVDAIIAAGYRKQERD